MTGTRLICFDVDGTLIDDAGGAKNIWDQIHRMAGTPEEENRRRFELFESGKITYSEWVDIDISGWQASGVRKDMILSVVRGLELMPSAKEVVNELRERGYILAVVSGSIDIGIDTLFAGHPFKYVYINRIYFDRAGRIKGWAATPYDLHRKALALKEIAEREGISTSECAFIGDNFNDIDAARTAGFSVAINCKSPELAAVADIVIQGKSLKQLLDYFPPRMGTSGSGE